MDGAEVGDSRPCESSDIGAQPTTQVTVQRASGTSTYIAVTKEESILCLQEKVARAWDLHSATQVRILAGANMLSGGQVVLDAGTSFTGVIQTKCHVCMSELYHPGPQLRTGSEEEERTFSRVLLCLQTRHSLEREGARWLWSQASKGSHDAERFHHEDSDSCSDYDASDFEEECSCCDEDYSDSHGTGSDGDHVDAPDRRGRNRHKDTLDCSYRCSSHSVRSARCSACLAATTSLCLQLGQLMCTKKFFNGIDTTFPKLQRLLVHDAGDGPTGVPYLAPIARLNNLRMLDLWFPGASNGDPGLLHKLNTLTNLTHLYILGLRYIDAAELEQLLASMLKLEVLYVWSGCMEGDSNTILDLSGHSSLQKLCLEGGAWHPPGSHLRGWSTLAIPAQLHDVAILSHNFKKRRPSWIDMLEKAHEEFRGYHKKRGIDIASCRQPWAERKREAYNAAYQDARERD